MSAFFLRTNTIYLAIWIALMLYGFYRYYKKVDFKNMSLSHFMCASFIFFWCGYITTAMFFGIEHLHLLPFMPFGVVVLARWYELNPVSTILGCLIPPTLLLIFYQVLAKYLKKYLIYYSALIIFIWLCLFFGGYVSFLYVLSWLIF